MTKNLKEHLGVQSDGNSLVELFPYEEIENGIRKLAKQENKIWVGMLRGICLN